MKETITDSVRIGEAVSRILREDSYIHISPGDFRDACPEPSWAVHVAGRGAGALLRLLREALEETGSGTPDGTVMHLRCASLTLFEIGRIQAAIPRAARHRNGLSFASEGSYDELWLFASVPGASGR